MKNGKTHYIVVARGKTAGGQWALSWPAWKWDRLTAVEQAAVIARQQQLMNSERRNEFQRPNGRKQKDATMEATDDTNNRKR